MSTAEAPRISRTTADDLLNDELIAFKEARYKFPRGTTPDLSSLHRYRSRGVGGVRLAAVRVGNRWFTSERAIREFILARSR